ncbi:F-box protein At1g67340-like [Phragmites australis]|uniref:F-box protein At1g67340-like n=1 Tax=Phragmites australis TaxID=29695 RepID=UPI002D797C42|nr:F-box protein At1g67340-like [Phragmites australis]
MRTRRGACYSCHAGEGPDVHRRKKRRTAAEGSLAVSGAPAGCGGLGDMFEELPDDLVVSILADVAASAGSPADLAGAMLTCKRFRELGQSRVVLARASPRCLAVPSKAWSDEAHRFLQRCADAGNLEACYLLGMIRFYCLGRRGSGAALMAAAAVGGHREALYSLAVIQFNGSGGSKDDRDLRAGAALCARAASLGHVDALRELGHCLQDGYGVRRSVLDGRRLLIQANTRELAAAVTASASLLRAGNTGNNGGKASRRHSCLLSDFGCRAAAGETHAANRFLVDWFASRPLVASSVAVAGSGAGTASADEETGGGLRLCSQALCGRPETRRHEFRRCSVCGVVNYCSRACQALHWKMAHKAECTPMDRWLDADDAAVAAPAP